MARISKKPGPAPSPRIRQKRERIRQEVLEAARKILLSDGIDAVTLASVAAELDLTKQALYHYFPSKEALLKALIAALLDDEIEAIVAAVEKAGEDSDVLGVMIRAFYDHYINALEAFRAIYCQSQLLPMSTIRLDEETLREEINPATRRLFDLLEDRLTEDGMSRAERRRIRRLAYSAWLSALGMMTMLSVADSAQDPLIYKDKELLDTLTRVYDEAAQG
jgi:AcrR family transcriptional regulator